VCYTFTLGAFSSPFRKKRGLQFDFGDLSFRVLSALQSFYVPTPPPRPSTIFENSFLVELRCAPFKRYTPFRAIICFPFCSPFALPGRKLRERPGLSGAFSVNRSTTCLPFSSARFLSDTNRFSMSFGSPNLPMRSFFPPLLPFSPSPTLRPSP